MLHIFPLYLLNPTDSNLFCKSIWGAGTWCCGKKKSQFQLKYNKLAIRRYSLLKSWWKFSNILLLDEKSWTECIKWYGIWFTALLCSEIWKRASKYHAFSSPVWSLDAVFYHSTVFGFIKAKWKVRQSMANAFDLTTSAVVESSPTQEYSSQIVKFPLCSQPFWKGSNSVSPL